ncbi:transposase [Streptomyces sp. NPDC059885]
MGVRADGTKELIATADGHHESSESWASLLRDRRRRGMRAPVPAAGNGAPGFRNAINQAFPETRHQRCPVHKTANRLDSLPRPAQPAAKKAIQNIHNAEDHSCAMAGMGMESASPMPGACCPALEGGEELDLLVSLLPSLRGGMDAARETDNSRHVPGSLGVDGGGHRPGLAGRPQHGTRDGAVLAPFGAPGRGCSRVAVRRTREGRGTAPRHRRDGAGVVRGVRFSGTTPRGCWMPDRRRGCDAPHRSHVTS